MVLAKRFFPVPRSPVIKMGASEATSNSAALSIRRKIPELVTMLIDAFGAWRGFINRLQQFRSALFEQIHKVSRIAVK
jgi:hypothetical protein